MPPRAWLAAVEAEGDPEDELVRLKTLSDVGRDCQGTTKRSNGCPAWGGSHRPCRRVQWQHLGKASRSSTTDMRAPAEQGGEDRGEGKGGTSGAGDHSEHE